MDEKIIFLGVGGDFQVVGKQEYCSGGIVVRTSGLQFHIDPGPGALTRARQCGINVRETTAILVSHAHLAHCNDVNALIAACTHTGIDRTAVLVGSKSLIEPDEAGHSILTKFHQKCVERMITVEPGKNIGINKVEIRATATKHTDKSAVGFKMTTPSYTLSYSGDTEYFEGLSEEYKGSNILILNVKDPFDRKSAGNLNADDAVKIIQEVKPQFVIITHFGSKVVQEGPLQIARDIQRLTKVPVVAAKDGMVVNPMSHYQGILQQGNVDYK